MAKEKGWEFAAGAGEFSLRGEGTIGRKTLSGLRLRWRVIALGTAPMIRLDNISKQHGHQILFIDASMGLQKGEKVGLVGPNGAGKTTIFRMIAGTEQPKPSISGKIDWPWSPKASPSRSFAR